MHDLLFSRRTTQACLDRLATVLAASDVQRLVDDVNRPGRTRLSKLWEVVILDALAQESSLRHEQPLSDGRRPDFAFDVAAGGQAFEVVGDIRCVSDAGLDRANPVAHFHGELCRIAKRRGIDPNRLTAQVRGQVEGRHSKAKVKLALPEKGAITAFIKAQLGQFLDRIGAASDAPSSITVDHEGSRIEVTYDPSRQLSGLGHLSYTVPYSLEQNPLAEGLKDKANQLKEAPDASVRLVIIADGNCNALRQEAGMGGHVTTQAIVEHFLRRNSTIDAVLLLPIVEAWQPGGSRIELAPKFLSRTTSGRRPPMPQGQRQALFQHLNAVVGHLPRPVISARNAAERCEKPDLAYGPHIGFRHGGNTLEISSRQLLEALAGQPSHGVNGLDYPLDAPPPPADWQRFFRHHLERGQMITKITVVPGGARDDDMLKFEFGAADPAISAFRGPPTA